VYTVDAIKSAKKLLLNDGLFVVKFQVDTPWIGGRLQGLLTMVFNQEPLQIQSASQYGTPGRFFYRGLAAEADQRIE